MNLALIEEGTNLRVGTVFIGEGEALPDIGDMFEGKEGKSYIAKDLPYIYKVAKDKQGNDRYVDPRALHGQFKVALFVI